MGIMKKFVFIVVIVLLCGCTSPANTNNGENDEIVSENQTEEQPDTLSENAGQSVSSDAGQAQNLSENEVQVENEVQEEDEVQAEDEAQAEDNGTYYTMEEVKALGIPEDMLAYWLVLNSKMPFVSYDEGSQEFYWDEYFWLLGKPGHAVVDSDQNSYWGKPSTFKIVDMNNDGKNEMAVTLDFGIVQILHYEDGVVYGYQFVYRGMSSIYLNGIYEGSSGASHAIYCRLKELNKDGYTEEKIAEVNFGYNDDSYYEMGGISVTQEEYEEFKQSLDDVGEAEEMDYTEEMLNEYLLGGISEEELYMVQHVAVEPMADTAEYPMEPEVMQAYYEALTGEKEFISVTDGNQKFYLDNYWQRNENDGEKILYFSIVDMDRDGSYEVVLTCGLGVTQILHYEDGNVYSYQFDYDGGIGAIANDGIFSTDNLYYYGRDDDKYGIINSFDEDECVLEEVDYNGNINDDRIRYYYFSEELIEQYFR